MYGYIHYLSISRKIIQPVSILFCRVFSLSSWKDLTTGKSKGERTSLDRSFRGTFWSSDIQTVQQLPSHTTPLHSPLRWMMVVVNYNNNNEVHFLQYSIIAQLRIHLCAPSQSYSVFRSEHTKWIKTGKGEKGRVAFSSLFVQTHFVFIFPILRILNWSLIICLFFLFTVPTPHKSMWEHKTYIISIHSQISPIRLDSTRSL